MCVLAITLIGDAGGMSKTLYGENAMDIGPGIHHECCIQNILYIPIPMYVQFFGLDK